MINLFKKSGRGPSTLVLFVSGLLILLLLFLRGRSTSPQGKIKSILVANGYSTRMATNWVAVSDFETGTWTSNLFKTANNLFGMKQPMKRATLSAGATKSGFASFKSLDDSVKDLVLYMKEFNYPKDFATLYEQVSFMKSKGYFEEPLDQYYAGVASRAVKTSIAGI